MFLSCYEVNLCHPEARRALSDTYEMHRSVMSVFGQAEDAPRKEMAILYRLVPCKGAYKLYVSSEQKPIKDMPSGFTPVPDSPKNLDAVIASFREGNRYSFNIQAVPSKKIANAQGGNSKRVFLGKEEERALWLSNKAEANGFQVISFNEEQQGNYSLKKSFFKAVVFKGTLRITDLEKFRDAYISGIGAEKAFGCGMLILSPAVIE